MIIKKCKAKGAYETIPEKPMRIDLSKFKNKFEVISELPILIIIKYKEYEVVCYKSGKIILKNCDSEDKAREIIEEVLK